MAVCTGQLEYRTLLPVNGRFIAFEIKTPSGKTTKLQEATIRKILNAGGVAAVVHSVDEVKAILEKHGLL